MTNASHTLAFSERGLVHDNTNFLREPHPALKTVLLYGRQIQTKSSCVILTRCHVKTFYSPRATPCRVQVLQAPQPRPWNSEASRGPRRIAPVPVAFSPALYKPTGVVTTLSRSWPTKRSDSTRDPISPKRALSTNPIRAVLLLISSPAELLFRCHHAVICSPRSSAVGVPGNTRHCS